MTSNPLTPTTMTPAPVTPASMAPSLVAPAPLKPWGLLAEFDTPAALLRAVRETRKAGYTRFDAHTPFPVHGMDQTMGMPRSKLGWIVAAAALIGGVGAMGGQMYCNWDYPMIHQGKPYQTWQAFLIITFEITVLSAAFAAVLGMFALNGLPKWYHPTLKSAAFARVTDNRFFLSIEAADKMFDLEKTQQFLQSLNPLLVELLQE